MTLTNREKAIAIISNGITVYSLYQKRGELPENTTMYEFILKIIPDNIRSEINADLIDEVFAFVSSAHSS
ncbi:MAG: hypothetical protein COW27_03020 [Nitrosopumilales archaeon CG15_BIG_FIL_POST_REV_8_21_14_020_37_12]|nr:MAG: hypothetical protein COW27_03020 [Nitrosopumilales archaeon CG15_BIG_FIL_POST_REV_8_21_14_020_37_12]